MPVYLRKFYLKKLVDVKNEEKEQVEKSSNKSNSNIPNRFKR